MAWASKTFTFSPSTVIRSSEVNDNFDDMVDQLNVAMPTYGGIFWTQSIASIPAGWYICDGANGTPDLIDKFIVCAGGTYAVHDEGGEATHTLLISEIPPVAHKDHTHTFTTGVPSGDLHFANLGDENEPFNGDTHTHSGTTADASAEAGGGGAHNNLPPFHALPIIMKS